MHIKSLNQEMMVLGQDEVCELRGPKGHDWVHEWNILSITDRREKLPLNLPDVRRVRSLQFEDVDRDYPAEGVFAATSEDVRGALAFSREVGREPLIIHCYAGISRSTAMAWLIVFAKLIGTSTAVLQSFEIVRTLRPILQPNRHVLALGIHLLAEETGSSEPALVAEFVKCLSLLEAERRFAAQVSP